MITVQINAVPLSYFVPRCYSDVESFDLATAEGLPTNPYRASKWPIGTNLNRAREQPMRNDPVARLSGIQVAERETRHGSRHDRRGAPLHTPHYFGPPPPPIKGRMARGVQNPPECR
jgi:hypothetical protein